MASLKKYRLELLAVASITIFYFVSRLYNLLELPVFTDEAIYLRWGQYLQSDFKFWDYAITDGKGPVFIWFMTLFMQIFRDPVLAGRLVSVVSGVFTMLGMYFLAKEVFKQRWIGILTAFLYAIYPFSLVYDRMALYDSLVGTFTVWGLYFVFRFARTLRIRDMLFLSIIAGFGAMNKSNGFFTVLLLPFTIILIDLKPKGRIKRCIRWGILGGISAALAYGMYSALRVSPYFHIIAEKNTIFVYPFHEWIQHPFRFFWGNLWAGQRDWFIRYFGFPFLILTIVSFIIKIKYWKEKIVLLIWFIIPFLVLALFGKTLYPRYVFPMTLSLLPLVAYSIYYLRSLIKNTALYCLVFFGLISYSLYVSYSVLTDFAHAPIPISDRGQYNNDWPSGTGVRESVVFFKEEAKKGKIAILTEGTFGLMPFAYELYLRDNENIMIKGFWPVGELEMRDAIHISKTMPTYVVFYQPCPACPFSGTAPSTWPLEKIKEYKKVKENTSLTIYKVVQ